MPSSPSSIAASSSFSGSSKVRQTQQVTVAAREQSLKVRAALLERLGTHILAVDHHEVEAPGAAAMGVARRQRMEVGNAVGIAADELGVDNSRRRAKHGFADDSEASGEVFASAAQHERASRAAVQLGSPAVVLHLVQPLRTAGRTLL